jgi:hypothetical protein
LGTGGSSRPISPRRWSRLRAGSGAELGIDNADYEVIDAQAMRFDDASFDGAICRWVFDLTALGPLVASLSDAARADLRTAIDERLTRFRRADAIAVLVRVGRPLTAAPASAHHPTDDETGRRARPSRARGRPSR